MVVTDICAAAMLRQTSEQQLCLHWHKHADAGHGEAMANLGITLPKFASLGVPNHIFLSPLPRYMLANLGGLNILLLTLWPCF